MQIKKKKQKKKNQQTNNLEKEWLNEYKEIKKNRMANTYMCNCIMWD